MRARMLLEYEGGNVNLSRVFKGIGGSLETSYDFPLQCYKGVVTW